MIVTPLLKSWSLVPQAVCHPGSAAVEAPLRHCPAGKGTCRTAADQNSKRQVDLHSIAHVLALAHMSLRSARICEMNDSDSHGFTAVQVVGKRYPGKRQRLDATIPIDLATPLE